MWKPDIRQTDEPLYLAIASQLARDVERGVVAPGAQLPTHRELARALRVNVGTITRAYAEASRRGLLEGEVGRGTFVRHPAARGFIASPPANVPDGVVDLAFNLPAGGPTLDEQRSVLREIAEQGELGSFFDGYHLAGLPRHREAGAAWLARFGVATQAERVIITGGAQHALAITLATCAQPGDVVLAEALTYTGVKSLARLLGLRVQPVGLDEHGLVPDAFEAACHGGSVRALYVQPNSQNPTGVTLDAQRRAQIVAIARQHGVALIEDDTYGFVRETEIEPLAALAPERTWFVTSLTKSLSPGPRVGLLVPPTHPADALERAIATVTSVGWTTPPVAAEIASRWILDGVAARVVAEKRAETSARQVLAQRALANVATPWEPGACHLWLPLPEPWRASEFVARVRLAGAAVTSAEAFVVGRGVAPHAVRVCIATPKTRAELERGLAALAGVLVHGPTAVAALV
jgi:DNA-binding transcriptional MocR family regulator